MTEARAHHFVPQCWLAGFTDSGEKDGKLYVTDLKRRKQWPSNPENTGHRRDFNRIDDPSVNDPLAIEKIFANMEDKLAPVLRRLNKERRGPKDSYELSVLLEYMGIQWVRVPTFRALVGRTVFSHLSKETLISRPAWESALRKAAIPIDHPDADYDKMLEAVNSGGITFAASSAFHLRQGAGVLEKIDASLKKMKWAWIVSQRGEFIGFDSPVAMDGAEGQPIGFANAGIVTYPVSRHVLIYGTHEPVDTPAAITMKLIARHNTFAMLSADEQVYSHRPDFHWLDASDKCRNDWTLFSSEEFKSRDLTASVEHT